MTDKISLAERLNQIRGNPQPKAPICSSCTERKIRVRTSRPGSPPIFKWECGKRGCTKEGQ